MPLRLSVIVSVVLALSVIAASGCTTGGAAPLDEDFYGDSACFPNVEDVLNSSASGDSPTDMACKDDCYRACGFDGRPHYERGVKYCVCEAGVFIECRCPRPEWYKGAPDAPYCDKYTEDGKGLTASFVDPITDDPVPCVRDGVADAVEWDQCVARDPVDGFTPRGCVCMDERTPFGQPSNPANLVWICASTEKWFYPEQSTIP